MAKTPEPDLTMVAMLKLLNWEFKTTMLSKLGALIGKQMA